MLVALYVVLRCDVDVGRSVFAPTDGPTTKGPTDGPTTKGPTVLFLFAAACGTPGTCVLRTDVSYSM
jgi:hypothetical protein